MLIYVNDMLTISKPKQKINGLKKILSTKFHMKDLDNVRKILCMVIDGNRSKNKLKIGQSSYLLKLINKFNMSSCKLVNM